jgi:hypothetical protein
MRDVSGLRRAAISRACVVSAVALSSCTLLRSYDGFVGPGTDLPDGANGSGPNDGAPNSPDSAERDPSACAQGDVVTLTAGTGPHLLASDGQGVYWADQRADGGVEIVATSRGATSTAPLDANPQFILPRSGTITTVSVNSTGYLVVVDVARAPFGATKELGIGLTNYSPYVATGDENSLFATGYFASSWHVDEIEPNQIALGGSPGTVGALATDGVVAYGTVLINSPGIFRFAPSGSARAFVPDAQPLGPLVMVKDMLVWLSADEELRSAPSAGGADQGHGTFSGASKLATDQDCVYIATGTEIIAVPASGAWASSTIASAKAVELTASRAGVFWKTNDGAVQAIWR